MNQLSKMKHQCSEVCVFELQVSFTPNEVDLLSLSQALFLFSSNAFSVIPSYTLNYTTTHHLFLIRNPQYYTSLKAVMFFKLFIVIYTYHVMFSFLYIILTK